MGRTGNEISQNMRGSLEVDLKLVEATIRVAEQVRERIEELRPPSD